MTPDETASMAGVLLKGLTHIPLPDIMAVLQIATMATKLRMDLELNEKLQAEAFKKFGDKV